MHKRTAVQPRRATTTPTALSRRTRIGSTWWSASTSARSSTRRRCGSCGRCWSGTGTAVAARSRRAGGLRRPLARGVAVVARGALTDRGAGFRHRVVIAMRMQTVEQGRYLGDRPPYGCRLVDAGPHPNRALARRGVRRQRLVPHPATAPVVGADLLLAPGGAQCRGYRPPPQRAIRAQLYGRRPGPQRTPGRPRLVVAHGGGGPGQSALHRSQVWNRTTTVVRPTAAATATPPPAPNGGRAAQPLSARGPPAGPTSQHTSPPGASLMIPIQNRPYDWSTNLISPSAATPPASHAPTAAPLRERAKHGQRLRAMISPPSSPIGSHVVPVTAVQPPVDQASRVPGRSWTFLDGRERDMAVVRCTA
ncbi:hypothetical protein FHS29_007245 [Saccharothrix tamanrassetensis]|uniref:Uncharacterized protein n=1 Tax=Saccharothrix tamanrassetensis TaxID=1051531 RepID=A0A841CX99_9PSEU|nr:hypothetical protein [Saccharothrix tamanrassetensis]